MKPRKLKLFFGFFPYGGVGSSSLECPTVRNWFCNTVLKARNDERIESLLDKDFSDTPITATRNEAVMAAQAVSADVLILIDSDMKPDCELGNDPLAKPFWESSFDFLYRHYEQGPVVVGAPYCGPPPFSNVYAFRWANRRNDYPADMRLEAFTREEASARSGIEEVAALPTGLIMYDMRAFDLISHPYFEYEWEGDGPPCLHCGCPKPGPRARKASTEDIVNTRDISQAGIIKLGYNPVHINWDSWAGHWKPDLVRKPQILTADMVGRRLSEAVLSGRRSDERLIFLPERYEPDNVVRPVSTISRPPFDLFPANYESKNAPAIG